MLVTRSKLINNPHTAKSMYGMISKYSSDLVPFKKDGLLKFFDYVKNLTYRRDRRGVEVVARPKYGLQMGLASGIDCKKKSILVSSYANMLGLPVRLIGSSTQKKKLFGKPRLHHVFPQIKINGRWVVADATYPKNKFGKVHPNLTRAVEFLNHV